MSWSPLNRMSASCLNDHGQGFLFTQQVHTRIQATEVHQAIGVLKSAIEDGQVSPWRVLGDVAGIGGMTSWRSLSRQFLWQVGDFLSGGVVAQRECQRQHGQKVSGCGIVI